MSKESNYNQASTLLATWAMDKSDEQLAERWEKLTNLLYTINGNR